jgi:hypothetical protein
MTTIEEQIWDYIDSSGTAGHRLEIERKIATDETYRSVYTELSAIHQQIGEISLDEPSMSFSRNVMEMVNLEMPPVSLKTKVDNRIIYSIAAFFILAMAVILVYVVSNIQLTMPKMTLTISMDQYLGQYVSPVFIKSFLFIDTIIGFLYLDRLLRRKRI